VELRELERLYKLRVIMTSPEESKQTWSRSAVASAHWRMRSAHAPGGCCLIEPPSHTRWTRNMAQLIMRSSAKADELSPGIACADGGNDSAEEDVASSRSYIMLRT